MKISDLMFHGDASLHDENFKTNKQKDKVQMTILIEKRENYRDDVHCPICNEKIADIENGTAATPCVHTLFVAHDEGFEFCSLKTRKNLGISNETDLNDFLINSDLSVDELTNKIDIPKSVKIAVYMPAPAFFGSYYGFAN